MGSHQRWRQASARLWFSSKVTFDLAFLDIILPDGTE